MRRAVAAAVAAVAAVALLSASGCSSSKASTASACSSLAACCLSLPAAEQASCASIVSTNSSASCTSLLAGYASVGTCSATIIFDAGTGQPGVDASSGGSSCAALASCCSALPSSEQPGCQAEVSLGLAATCTSALQGFVTAGQCGVVKSDASTPTGFSGPSCPAGQPPNAFVSTDGGVNCQSCASNCVTSSGFTASCASYYGCFCACAAGDTGCQQACAPLQGDCANATSSVESCVASDCASLCPAAPVTGKCTGDAGTAAGFDPSTCTSCQQTCASQISAFQSACTTYPACLSGCACSDAACVEGCIGLGGFGGGGHSDAGGTACSTPALPMIQCLQPCPTGCPAYILENL